MECCRYCGTSNNLYAFKGMDSKELIVYSCLECYRAQTEARIKGQLGQFRKFEGLRELEESEAKFKLFCYACDRYIPSSVGCERVPSSLTEQRRYLCLNCTARLNGTVAAVITKCSACGRTDLINTGDRLCSPCMEAAVVTLQQYYEKWKSSKKPESEPEPEKNPVARLILI